MRNGIFQRALRRCSWQLSEAWGWWRPGSPEGDRLCCAYILLLSGWFSCFSPWTNSLLFTNLYRIGRLATLHWAQR